ncbi:MAG: DUF2796 domain-containing protein [Azoarcus sp.]|jgi:hypothetical protein|nr:DUF2796 domain-containing protein [Azoarcus sp.]
MKTLSKLLIAFCGFTAFTSAAHEAHVHGQAQMSLAVENQEVEIELEAPLASFLSFEHEPTTDAQKKEVRNMALTLHKADSLFLLPVDAKCQITEISLESDAISNDLLSPDIPEDTAAHHHGHEASQHEEHSDIDVEITFACRNPQKLNSLTVDLFRAFPNLQKINVQMVTPKGQGAAELTPQSNTLRW